MSFTASGVRRQPRRLHPDARVDQRVRGVARLRLLGRHVSAFGFAMFGRRRVFFAAAATAGIRRRRAAVRLTDTAVAVVTTSVIVGRFGGGNDGRYCRRRRRRRRHRRCGLCGESQFVFHPVKYAAVVVIAVRVVVASDFIVHVLYPTTDTGFRRHRRHLCGLAKILFQRVRVSVDHRCGTHDHQHDGRCLNTKKHVGPKTLVKIADRVSHFGLVGSERRKREFQIEFFLLLSTGSTGASCVCCYGSTLYVDTRKQFFIDVR